MNRYSSSTANTRWQRQLVFNEYGENFVKFLIQQIHEYQPEIVVIGGNNHAWELCIPHVKDLRKEYYYSHQASCAWARYYL